MSILSYCCTRRNPGVATRRPELKRRNPSGPDKPLRSSSLHSMLYLRSFFSWSKHRLSVRSVRFRHFPTQNGSGCCTTFRGRGLASFGTASEGGSQLKVPLSERALKCVLPLSNILSWYKVAAQETRTISAVFLEADDPTTKDLLVCSCARVQNVIILMCLISICSSCLTVAERVRLAARRHTRTELADTEGSQLRSLRGCHQSQALNW